MEDNANTPEKKLFVDEDWKSQVEREQEAARQSQQQEAAGDHPKGSPASDTVSASAGAQAVMPPADLTFLIGMLYMQGVMALGAVPNPATNKREVHREQAKFAIDLLAMLQQKTEGNRTADESAEIEGVLHELRMAYIGVNESAKPPTA